MVNITGFPKKNNNSNDIFMGFLQALCVFLSGQFKNLKTLVDVKMAKSVRDFVSLNNKKVLIRQHYRGS